MNIHVAQYYPKFVTKCIEYSMIKYPTQLVWDRHCIAFNDRADLMFDIKWRHISLRHQEVSGHSAPPFSL
jgi:hypothetical protein